MGVRQNYGGLDVFRIIAAVLVIAIHTSPLTSYSAGADFLLTRILARTAVPFFFMVTGQFVLSDMLWGTATAKSMGRVKDYIKKLALMYIAATIIYLPIGIYSGYWNVYISKMIQMIVFDGTFYHLWYFPACITGILVVCGLRRILSLKGTMTAAGILYMIGLFGDSYFGFIQNVPIISNIYSFCFQIFSYTRNGLFMAPVFLVMGGIIGGTRRSRDRAAGNLRPQIALACLAVSLTLLIIEGFWLRTLGVMRHDSMYIMLLPVMAFLYSVILSWKQQNRVLLRTAATWIYILHPAMIVVVRGMAKIMHQTAFFVENSLIHYLTVTVLTMTIAFLIALVQTNEQINKQTGQRTVQHTGRAWIELDFSALAENVRFLQSRLPEGCQLMPAVKADAYGHGAVLMARELNRLGVRAFCVACASEGAVLREHGIKGEILVLGYTHPHLLGLLERYHLTQTVIDYDYAKKLNQYGRPLHVHIGVDTGMHRLGERSENIDRICEICGMEHLIVDGLFTHLCVSDTLRAEDRAYTKRQAQAFYGVADALKKRGYGCPKLHLQSSYGVLNYPELAGDYARVGIALYGVLSTGEDTEKWQGKLHPVLSLKTRVTAVKELYAGEAAGYGLAFVAGKDMKIAVLAIGYADGLPRGLSGGKGAVLINGRRAPIIGRMCMDQTIVDVSGIPEVRAGDIAVCIGKSGSQTISVCDLAAQAGTITNEILSRLGARLERVEFCRIMQYNGQQLVNCQKMAHSAGDVIEDEARIS